jgi:chromosome segregation ATPase
MNEREESERKFAAISNKLTELAIKITSITGASITSDVAGLELIIAKINDIVTENSTLKGQLLTKTDTLTSKETENKANTETIQRLVTELNKFEKDAATIKIQMDALKAERDTALTTKSMLEKELEVHKERIISIQTAWQASRVELEAKDTELAGHNANLKQFENDALFYKNCLNSLKEQVATLLSDGFVKVDANEDQIKEKVKLLMTSSKDRGLVRVQTQQNKIHYILIKLFVFSR